MLDPKDCHIGMEFWSDTGHWRCTDVGQRTIVAIKMNSDHPDAYKGPPYLICPEFVLTETRLEDCFASKEERDREFPGVYDGPIDPESPENREALLKELIEGERQSQHQPRYSEEEVWGRLEKKFDLHKFTEKLRAFHEEQEGEEES